MQKQLQDIESQTKLLQEQKLMNQKLEMQLINYYPKIQEANAIADLLNRNITFHPFIASINTIVRGGLSSNRPIVQVKVANQEQGWNNFWSLEKFEDRLVLMNDIAEHFLSQNEIAYLHSPEMDPFYDPKEFFLMARGVLLTKPILYLFDIEEKVELFSYDGLIGYLRVKVFPLNSQGQKMTEDDLDAILDRYDLDDIDPITIKKHGIPINFRIRLEEFVLYRQQGFEGKQARIEFELMGNDGDRNSVHKFETEIWKIEQKSKTLDFEKQMLIQDLNVQLQYYYLEQNLVFQFYIDEMQKVQKLGKNPPPIISEEIKRKSTKQKLAVMDQIRLQKISNGWKGKERRSIHQGDKKKDKSICSVF